MILASNSPRRKALLCDAGFDFESKAIETDESYPTSLPKHTVAKYLATKKNQYYQKVFEGELIITADTTVLLGDELLEKPLDGKEAASILLRLSGNTHQVITGVCIANERQEVSFDDITEVTFKELSDAEINHYIEVYEPFDKAGAYGIQEWIGMIGIIEIKGSYFNVMGLPTAKVYQVLKNDFGVLPYQESI